MKRRRIINKIKNVKCKKNLFHLCSGEGVDASAGNCDVDRDSYVGGNDGYRGFDVGDGGINDGGLDICATVEAVGGENRGCKTAFSFLRTLNEIKLYSIV